VRVGGLDIEHVFGVLCEQMFVRLLLVLVVAVGLWGLYELLADDGARVRLTRPGIVGRLPRGP